MSFNNNEENIINHSIRNKDVIDREELIQYLTYLLEHDGEVERFFERWLFEAPYPDILGFRDWLQEQTFDNMIRESYFEDYTIQLFEDIGDYDPNSFLHRHINWNRVCEDLFRTDYDSVFYDDENPFNIFGEEFYYHI